MIAAAATFLRDEFGEDYAVNTLDAFEEAVRFGGLVSRLQPSPAGLH